jgi:hypothetical protein
MKSWNIQYSIRRERPENSAYRFSGMSIQCICIPLVRRIIAVGRTFRIKSGGFKPGNLARAPEPGQLRGACLR